MDCEALSTQLEKLPAYGLKLELTRVQGFVLGLYYGFFVLLAIACYVLKLAVIFPLAMLLIVLWGRFVYQKSLLRSHPAAIKSLVFTELGWCFVKQNNGRVYKADISKDTIVTEYFVLLNLSERTQHQALGDFFKQQSVLLTAKETGEDSFRHIKRYLRLINFSKKND